MSLCIAVAAQFNGEPRIVLCFDMKVSTDVASAETEFKFVVLGSGLVAVLAGEIPAARELLSVYDAQLEGKPLDWKNAVEELRGAPRIRKRRMVEEYVQARLGISYEDFLKRGKDDIEPAIRRQMFTRIHDMELGVQLIICGFIPHAAMFKLDWDRVEEHRQFACIGAGAAAAEQTLYRRKQEYDTTLTSALYNAYEAKKLGELAPSVGSETVVLVMEAPLPNALNVPFVVSRGGRAHLEQQYKRYGPRPTPVFPELPDGFFAV